MRGWGYVSGDALLIGLAVSRERFRLVSMLSQGADWPLESPSTEAALFTNKDGRR